MMIVTMTRHGLAALLYIGALAAAASGLWKSGMLGAVIQALPFALCAIMVDASDADIKEFYQWLDDQQAAMRHNK